MGGASARDAATAAAAAARALATAAAHHPRVVVLRLGHHVELGADVAHLPLHHHLRLPQLLHRVHVAARLVAAEPHLAERAAPDDVELLEVGGGELGALGAQVLALHPVVVAHRQLLPRRVELERLHLLLEVLLPRLARLLQPVDAGVPRLEVLLRRDAGRVGVHGEALRCSQRLSELRRRLGERREESKSRLGAVDLSGAARCRCDRRPSPACCSRWRRSPLRWRQPRDRWRYHGRWCNRCALRRAPALRQELRAGGYPAASHHGSRWTGRLSGRRR